MPELPEVETIRVDLTRTLLGKTLQSFTICDPRLLIPHSPSDFERVLTNSRWLSFNRKGKYLWVDLASGWKVVFHLRMTGQLLLASSDGEPKKYRMKFEFKEAGCLYFCDERRFGEVRLVPVETRVEDVLNLGPDALEISASEFIRRMKQHKTPIKSLLMDQHVLSGVGNIYAQEALFRSGLRPTRSAKRVSAQEAQKLYDQMQALLHEAIEQRGSTSRNYRDALGQSGNAQSLHRVYRKEGEPCFQCQRKLKGLRQGGRGTVYCSYCQR